jgi:hypothetical protein
MVFQVLSLPLEVYACLRTDVSGRCKMMLGLAGKQGPHKWHKQRRCWRRCVSQSLILSHHLITSLAQTSSCKTHSFACLSHCLRSHDCPPSTTAPTHRTSTSTSPARLYPPVPPHDQGTRFSQPKPRAQDHSCQT